MFIFCTQKRSAIWFLWKQSHFVFFQMHGTHCTTAQTPPSNEKTDTSRLGVLLIQKYKIMENTATLSLTISKPNDKARISLESRLYWSTCSQYDLHRIVVKLTRSRKKQHRKIRLILDEFDNIPSLTMLINGFNFLFKFNLEVQK